MRIFIHAISSCPPELGVEPHDTIGDVKRMIEDRCGNPTHDQRLFFEGKELKDGPSLVDYNIQDESTLSLIVNLRGPLGPPDGLLFHAARSGDAAGVLARIEFGVNVNHLDEQGQSPLVAALAAGHFDVVKVLIHRSADVHQPGPTTPLLAAVRSEDVRAVRALVRAGASPTTPEEEDFLEDDALRVEIRACAPLRALRYF
ncbi:ubiquitin-related domain-containing protein [Pelagophyceae sp. CCMP2097]|nr:ubiquitin-related domain-containing protein [Pelagophyceae sp. CCMP2097]